MNGPDRDEPMLPERTRDETPEGWSEDEPTPDDDVRRLLEERPPHHDRDDG